VVDSVHDDEMLVVDDLVDGAVGAAAGGVKTGKFAMEGSADSVGVLAQGPEQELDDGGGGTSGELGELSFGWAGDL
jgi:hypothetical protein